MVFVRFGPGCVKIGVNHRVYFELIDSEATNLTESASTNKFGGMDLKDTSFLTALAVVITLVFLPIFANADVPLPRGYEQDCSSNLPNWFNDAEEWAFEQICRNGRADFDLELGLRCP